MENRFVIDSVGFINYFNDFFEEKDMLSRDVRKKLKMCIENLSSSHKLIIPSVVFIEVFRKFLLSQESVKKFHYNIFRPITENENIEIKPIEEEVLNIFCHLNDFPMELNDKIIFASAIQLGAPLITKDPVIQKYNQKRGLLPSIIF